MKLLQVSHCGIHAPLLLLGLLISNEVNAAGAAIVIYAEIDEVQYVLLADHKHPMQVHRGWSILGGTVENDETLRDAAVREVIEESNGAFDEAVIRKAIDYAKSLQISDNTIFVAKSRFQPAAVYSHKVARLANGARGERGPFAWVPWRIIAEAAIEAGRSGNDCSKSPVMIPPEYLPENRQTSWYSCWFMEGALLIERNGGLLGSSR